MKPTLISVTALLLLSTHHSVQCARILGIFPLPGRSHYILGSSLMRALAEHGHDVTVVSTFGEKTPPKGTMYKDIVLNDVQEAFQQQQKGNTFERGNLSPFVTIPFFAARISNVAELVIKDENLQQLINSEENFDAVIIGEFCNDAHKSLAAHFGGVQIVFSALSANFFVNQVVGNPSPLAYIPDVFLSYSAHMTFCERLTNTFVYLLHVAVYNLYLYPKQKAMTQKYIPQAPNLEDLIYNASLILLNSHPSLSQPVPHVPSMVEIGGFHIKPPKKLPEDLQKFLDSAKDGVIYFSMGSNLRSADLPVEKRDAILKVFSKLKEKVLWKWEEDILPGQPENVKLSKWLPQQDILAHPNVKLFITHGGLLSTTETIYFGVPVLAIPIFGDQKLNAQTAVTGGFGLSLSYNDLTEEKLTEKLNELLGNSKYSITSKTKSKIFHDRQVKPVDEALYWIDYVIRHKGAPNLRVAGVELPWYKYLLLDVIAFITVMSIIGVSVTCFVARKIFKKLCTKRKQQKLKKN